jgi:hypothetical protein
MRPKRFELAQKTRVHLRHQNAARISAIHHALGKVDPSNGYVFRAVDIRDAINKAGVQANSYRNAIGFSQCIRNFHGRAHWRANVRVEKNKRHSITCRQ